VPLLGLRRIALSGAVVAGVVLLGAWNGVRRNAAPDACKFVSVAEVSALTGAQVGGGQISTVDNPKSVTSSCMYTTGGRPSVIVMVGDYPTAAAAHQELVTEMHNSSDNVAEPGIGDGAFATSVNAVSITAVRGPRLATIAIIGGAAAMHDKLHALMVKALAR
jgi:hypothetical protein